jgi:hypothetical protein
MREGVEAGLLVTLVGGFRGAKGGLTLVASTPSMETTGSPTPAALTAAAAAAKERAMWRTVAGAHPAKRGSQTLDGEGVEAAAELSGAAAACCDAMMAGPAK